MNTVEHNIYSRIDCNPSLKKNFNRVINGNVDDRQSFVGTDAYEILRRWNPYVSPVIIHSDEMFDETRYITEIDSDVPEFKYRVPTNEAYTEDVIDVLKDLFKSDSIEYYPIYRNKTDKIAMSVNVVYNYSGCSSEILTTVFDCAFRELGYYRFVRPRSYRKSIDSDEYVTVLQFEPYYRRYIRLKGLEKVANKIRRGITRQYIWDFHYICELIRFSGYPAWLSSVSDRWDKFDFNSLDTILVDEPYEGNLISLDDVDIKVPNMKKYPLPVNPKDVIFILKTILDREFWKSELFFDDSNTGTIQIIYNHKNWYGSQICEIFDLAFNAVGYFREYPLILYNDYTLIFQYVPYSKYNRK